MFKVISNTGFMNFCTSDGNEFKMADGDNFGFRGDSLLYSDKSPLIEHKVISPNLELEVNAPGSFSFTITEDNPQYDTIEPMNTIVKIYQDGVEDDIFEGRVTGIDTDFYKQKSVYCEGELAYLFDTTQQNTVRHFNSIREYLSYVITIHNNKTPDYKHFTLGVVTVDDPNFAYTARAFGFETTWDTIGKLIEVYGGILRVRKQSGVRYLDYLQSEDELPFCEQEIVFGKNLLDHTTNFEVSQLCTVLVPLGATKNEAEGMPDEGSLTPEQELEQDLRITIESVNNGSPYLIAKEAYDTYGWIEKTVTFSEITDPALLKSYGELYLNELQFAEMNIEATAIDLSYTNRKEMPNE